MTKIEWTDATWNPVTGCTRVSAGCDHCYAVRQTYRLEGMGLTKKYGGLTVLNRKGERHFNGVVKCHEDALSIPLRWRKPRRVFVNSMSDLFHGRIYGQKHGDSTWVEGGFNGVGFQFLTEVWHVMRQCPQHTFQILTKRPRIMADLVWRVTKKLNISEPLPNVLLGTSCEDQPTLDKRIGDLLRCLAAVRFLSCEPLLGEIDVSEYLRWTGRGSGLPSPLSDSLEALPDVPGIDWVIIGCESKGAYAGRFADGYADAAGSIIDQCRAAGVPAFHKQMPINGRVSHNPTEWPEDLRIREWPKFTPKPQEQPL